MIAALRGAVVGLALLSASATQAASVKDVLESYGMLGTFAADCSAPVSARNQHVVFRALDENVQRDVMADADKRLEANVVDSASGLGPNQVEIGFASERIRVKQILRVEDRRWRIIESGVQGGDKAIIGGRVVRDRSESPWVNNCGPNRQAAPDTVALQLCWSAQRGDNFTTATAEGEAAAKAAGYACGGVEGRVLVRKAPGTEFLRLYWNAERGDHFTTATAEGQRAAEAAGYTFIRVEGYVYAQQAPGTVPLELYWSDQRRDNFTTATERGKINAKAAGYRFVRIEGYVYPP